jgi:tetratricopeptide (TPR) repeat protein
MPTSIEHNELFNERPCLSLDEIKAYTGKNLDHDVVHSVEAHMATCALCNDAVEGYMEIPAFDLSSQLGRKGRGSNHWTNGLVRGVVVAAIGLSTGWLFWYLTQPTVTEPPVADVISNEVVLYDPAEELAQLNEEVESATTLPQAEQVGHDERSFIIPPAPAETAVVDSAVTPIVRTEEHIETIEPVHPDPTEIITDARPVPRRLPVQNRQLIFKNYLKLVHPLEMYSAHSATPDLTGTPAGQMASPQEPDNVQVEQLTYLEMMDRATAFYVSGDHKSCAKLLNLWLNKWPKDVNAQFYIGLCYYNLGLYEKAFDHLEAARKNEIDTFKEEATWYSALSFEQMKGFGQARERFEKIANVGGFYSDRAYDKLNP